MIIKHLKQMWAWFWSSTTVDEQVEEKVSAAKKEVKHRVRRVKEELQDVREASEEVLSQARDVVGAVKGSKKRGRKSNKTVNNK
jgi:signal transduction histidine kinase